jgi:hypothetical protein
MLERVISTTAIACGVLQSAMDKLNQAAAMLGRKGGKAGTGTAKRRGDSAYYKRLAAKAVKARRKK